MTNPTTAEICKLADQIIENGQAEYGNPLWYEPADLAYGVTDSDDAAYVSAVSPERITALLGGLKAAEAKLKSVDEFLGELIGEGENEFADRLYRAMKGVKK